MPYRDAPPDCATGLRPLPPHESLRPPVMLLRRLIPLAASLSPLPVLLGALLGASLALPPAATAQTTQFWPEIQFAHLVTEVDQVQLMLRMHDNLSRGELSRAAVGGRWAHSFNSFFEGAVGYRHDNSVNRLPYQENRFYLDQIGRFGQRTGFGGDLRLREEFRWQPNGFSVRIRPALLVRNRVEIGHYTTIPFVSAEAFWDSRLDRVTQLRFTAGTALPVNKNFSIDPYFHHQFDPAGIFPSTNTIGLILLTRF